MLLLLHECSAEHMTFIIQLFPPFLPDTTLTQKKSFVFKV